MPTTEEAIEIVERFADQYGINLEDVVKNKASLISWLKTLKNKNSPISPADAKQIYDSYEITPISTKIAPDLETISYDDVPIEADLLPRLLEQNLDAALGFCQMCTKIRSEYNEVAKLYVETSIKGDQFIRLYQVYLEEIAEGQLWLDYEEACTDATVAEYGLDGASKQFELIKSVLEDPFSAVHQTVDNYPGALNEDGFSYIVGEEISLAKAMSNGADGVDGFQRAVSSYRSALEHATWLRSLRDAEANRCAWSVKAKSARDRAGHLSMGVGFRMQKDAISYQGSLLQLLENCRPNSPVNYKQRLMELKDTFDMAFRKLASRSKLLSQSLNQYDINVDMPAMKTGQFVDALFRWLQIVRDEVSKARTQQRVGLFTKWSPVDSTSGTALLSLSPLDIGQANGLLRGIAVEYEGGGVEPISVSIAPPVSLSLGTRRGVDAGTLICGRTMPLSAYNKPQPLHADRLWNGSPFGDWTFSTASPTGNGPVEQLVVHFWIAYR